MRPKMTDASRRLPAFGLVFLCLFALSSSLPCSAQAQPQVSRKPAPAPPLSPLAQPVNTIPGLENFAKVSDALYRGAQPEREGFEQLKKMGIKTVINLRDNHSDRLKLRGLGFRYVHIPCEASDPDLANVIAFLKVVTDPAYQPVFVHCQHGSDRTGMMVACYRMAVQGWPKDRALAELPNFGFHTVWKDIRTFLKTLDPAALKAKLATSPAPPVEIVP
jgi:tyrosine-protein phosphatase SIW14